MGGYQTWGLKMCHFSYLQTSANGNNLTVAIDMHLTSPYINYVSGPTKLTFMYLFILTVRLEQLDTFARLYRAVCVIQYSMINS